ncbi:MAG: PEGA domain-containing protein [Labilithrix sp.]
MGIRHAAFGLCALVACAAPPRPPSVAVVARGQPAEVERVRGALEGRDVGVDLRFVEPPVGAAAPATSTVQLERSLADARADYMSGELARIRRCAEKLEPPELLWQALEQDVRATASRILVWKVACLSIARRDAAVAAAGVFAALELELPPDIDVIPVEAHRILTSALVEAEARPRVSVKIDATGAAGARVAIDGRRAVCHTPCAVDLRSGEHFVAITKDGFAPVTKTFRVESGTAAVTLAPPPADPDLAARQWSARFGGDLAAGDTTESLWLLSRALRVQRFLYLQPDRVGDKARVRGALLSAGAVEAREEQRGELAEASRAVTHDLLVRGHVVEDRSLLKRPLFWTAVGIAVIVSASLTAYLLYDPGERTVVRTR